MSSYAHAAGTPGTGAYRNLTATFLRYRDASRAHSRPFNGAKGARVRYALPRGPHNPTRSNERVRNAAPPARL